MPRKDTPVNQPAFDKLIAEKAQTIGELIDQALRLAQGSAPFSDKASGLLDIAQHLCDTIAPYTPCTKGCNHCCYMAVSISSYEAEMISRYNGRPLATPGKHFMELAVEEDMISKYTGVPCSLLKDGKCSVYPVRPVVCRTHHNLAVDETNCIIAGVDIQRDELPTTPAVNLTEYSLAETMVMVQGDCTFGDIRDFFPAE